MQVPSPEFRILRDRISHEMAFPLGYERLAQVFGDLPAWPDCCLHFRACPTCWASKFTHTLKANEPYRIASVGHRFQSPGFSIEIFPVARALKSVAREAFLLSGLEAFRRFIVAGSAPGHCGFCEAIFDPVSHACTVRTSVVTDPEQV